MRYGCRDAGCLVEPIILEGGNDRCGGRLFQCGFAAEQEDSAGERGINIFHIRSGCIAASLNRESAGEEREASKDRYYGRLSGRPDSLFAISSPKFGR